MEEAALAGGGDGESGRSEAAALWVAVVLFAGLSLACAVLSEGFVAADACTHYLYAKYAFVEPLNWVDVWARPVVTALYAVPARFGGRLAVRIVSMLVAVGCGLVGLGIARGQGMRRPGLALIFTLGQPLLFLHSFGEMTELPFALLAGGAFWAYQGRRWLVMAALAALLPATRPEGFAFIAFAAVALVLHRRWWWLVVLPLPLLAWDIAGWELTREPGPWWRWLIDAWPYSADSMYGRGSVFTFVATLPVVVGPAVLPPMLIGLWRGLQEPVRDRALDPHLRRCRFLTAVIPLFVLVSHSLLWRLGKMSSFGEPRYLLVVAPVWGVLSARGWEWVWTRFRWGRPLRWAGLAALAPVVANLVHPVVPVRLSDDWRAAKRFAAWYQSTPAHTRYPRVLASHPGVFYFLGASPTGESRGGGFSRSLIAACPAGTILIWDPKYSGLNATPDQTTTLAAIRAAGWVEDMEAEAAVNRAQAEEKRQWHIYHSALAAQ